MDQLRLGLQESMRLLPENEMIRMQQRRQTDSTAKDIWEVRSKGVLSVTSR